MGFWHTGYMEFHEPTDEGRVTASVAPRPVTYPCEVCGLVFSSERDLRTHTFDGHATKRPALTYKGRECGRSRLLVTAASVPADWQSSNATELRLNDATVNAAELAAALAEFRSGVHAVTLTNEDLHRTFEFDYSLASDDDLRLVDQALDHLMAGGRLERGTIDAFIIRTGYAETARRYREGISAYLYGVLAREHDDEPDQRDQSDAPRYEQRYNQAVNILGSFDRPPAEAICGMVALHYNQFDLAMRKTNSHRVSDVAARLRAILANEPVGRGSLMDRSHASLDQALSDSVMERVLSTCALPIDGSRLEAMRGAAATIPQLRPSDQFKLRLVAAEALLTGGDFEGASTHAEVLRHSKIAEAWYSGFRTRLQGATR